jgi:hypothetical protein
MSPWGPLAELRGKGQRPSLPVFVTTRKSLGWNIGREFIVVHVPHGTKHPARTAAGVAGGADAR